MPDLEELSVDELADGARLSFAPNTVGIRHAEFGRLSPHVNFVERCGDALVAELSDGRRLVVRHRSEPVAYALRRISP